MEPLLLTDYEKIKPYLDMADYEGYNSNFVTMMMWNHEYHVEYEIQPHFCFMLHHYKGTTYFSMPYTSPEYYKEAIDYMYEYAQREHISFMIDFAVPKFVEEIKKIYPEKFIFERTRDFDDYVYDRNMLMTLTGKKMQKRRNHYNSFIKSYPDHEYRALSIDDDFDLILGCLTKWETDKEATESLVSEVYGILYLLSSKHILDIKLGGIFINNQLKAFIIASPLKHKTIQIHVEKADKSIRGLYPAILKEFLEHEYPDYEYVNREEDMGMENLRRSKMNLHPCHMVEKSRVFTNWSVMEKANVSDKEEIKALWLSRFEDEDMDSSDFYFEHCFREENTYITRFHNRIISAIQIRPFKINECEESYFILGVATDQSYEGQGIMGRLMKKVLDDYQGKRLYLQAYEPEIYKRYGFETSHLQQVIKVNKRSYINTGKTDLYLSKNRNHLLDSYNEYVQRFNEYMVRDESYYQDYLFKRCEAWGDEIRSFNKQCCTVGYMVYHETKDEINISELIYREENLDSIMTLLASSYNKRIIVHVDLKAIIEGKAHTEIIMMCNQGSKYDSEDKYINEVY